MGVVDRSIGKLAEIPWVHSPEIERSPGVNAVSEQERFQFGLTRGMVLLWIVGTMLGPIILWRVARPVMGPWIWIWPLAVPSGLIAHALLRRGQHEWAARLLIGAAFVTMSADVLTRHGVSSPASAMFLPLVVASSLILGRRWALTIAGASLIVLGASFLLAQGQLSPTEARYLAGDFTISAFLLAVTTVMAAVVQTQVEKSRNESARRQRAQRGLYEDLRSTTVSRSYLNRVLQSMGDALLVTDLEGSIETVNAIALGLTGYSEVELRGRKIHELFESGESLLGRPGHFDTESLETRMRKADGHSIPVSVSRAFMKEEDTDAGMVFVAKDITERRAAEIELRMAKDVAEQAARSKAGLLASMSHEIRTPLNAIVGLTSVLSDTPLDEEQDALLETVRESCDALVDTIDRILDYSSIEYQKIDVEIKPYDVRQTVDSVVDILRLRAGRKGLAMHCKVADDVPRTLEGDAPRLKQILLNLVGNAVKFTSTGYVSVQVLRDPRDPEARILYRVHDTGVGINRNDLDELFRPYVRAKPTADLGEGGAGLGLAICQQLVQVLEGEIEVESSPEKGTTFTVGLPCKPANLQDAPSSSTSKARPGFDPSFASDHPLRILVAEDNYLNRKVVRLFLERLGFSADFVANGQEVLTALDAKQYDTILMDIQMPDMDGVETAQRVREQMLDDATRPRMIAMTAHALEGSREHYLSSGLDDYLSKPFRVDELKAVLSKCKKP